MHTLPLAPIKRLMKNAGAERVSKEAVEELRDILEDEVRDYAEQANKLARHAGRKTIQAEDIRLSKW